jgi:hypothetical protein
MIRTPDPRRCQLIARHVTTEYARDKVLKALYEAVHDGLEFGPRDLPLAEDREWIRGAIAMPLQEAADAALEALTWNVSRALERAPDGLLDRFERSHSGKELGAE